MDETRTLYEERVRALCDLSLTRLRSMLDPRTGLFVHHVSGDALVPAGESVRYTAMTVLGLEKAEKHGLQGGPEIEPLLQALDRARPRVKNVGDLALTAWAAARRSRPIAERALEALLAQPHFAQTAQSKDVHSTELAWVVRALTEATAEGLGPERLVRERLAQAFGMLLEARGPSGLVTFSRPLVDSHVARGSAAPSTPDAGFSLRRGLRGELGFFDAQVYTIQAALAYDAVVGDARAKETARTIGKLLLEHQGPLGQWAWHYNTRTGEVVDLYPVYSVHQDGMAPMALLPLEAQLGVPTTAAVARGVNWLFGENEIQKPMVDLEKATIWRSVRRRDPVRRVVYPLKFASLVRQTAQLGLSRRLASPALLEIDREFRPYHLGFCLLAFSELATRAPATVRAPDSAPGAGSSTGSDPGTGPSKITTSGRVAA